MKKSALILTLVIGCGSAVVDTPDTSGSGGHGGAQVGPIPQCTPGSFCGDGLCVFPETQNNCPSDCSCVISRCGDLNCDAFLCNETPENCPSDCQDSKGCLPCAPLLDHITSFQSMCVASATTAEHLIHCACDECCMNECSGYLCGPNIWDKITPLCDACLKQNCSYAVEACQKG